jgi:hypothetical protein
VLVFDTLRADFQRFQSSNDGLRSFQRLESITPEVKSATCGSFPTIPMRTDSLTGRLCFLDQRWGTPTKEDQVLPLVASRGGIVTILVTDNYMMLTPSLGGIFGQFFREVVFVRGAGSDPFQSVSECKPSSSIKRPCRNLSFETQYLSNARYWKLVKATPWQRLFELSEQALLRLISGKKPFMLWVDCFSTHEPWIHPSEIVYLSDEDPILPPYGSCSQYTSSQLAALKGQYADRIRSVDGAMTSFAGLLEDEVRRGDLALIVLSDHGFLFGEYGQVGKPKSIPVMPELYNIVFRSSEHLCDLLSASNSWQPIYLPFQIAELLGFSFPRPASNTSFTLIGRNTPLAATLSVKFDKQLLLLWRENGQYFPKTLDTGALDPFLCWKNQTIVDNSSIHLYLSSIHDHLNTHEWGRQFIPALMESL